MQKAFWVFVIILSINMVSNNSSLYGVNGVLVGALKIDRKMAALPALAWMGGYNRVVFCISSYRSILFCLRLKRVVEGCGVA
ncbi:MAG: hypothetical protein V4615_05870, partial [Bacteroidota bacterium]